MGKGTKHASDWKMTTLKVAIDARRLYCHSVKIMSNEKVFKPSNDFRGATLMTIHELLLDVYIKTWEANRINAVRHPESATESGKVLKFRDRKRVKEIRRRMVRLSHRIERGETRREALAESYQCVRSMLVKGNSARLLRRMGAFYKNLEMEIDNEERCRKAA